MARDAEQIVERLRDPLSPPTRSARRGLLVSSMIGIAIVLGDLVPTEIDALGIQLGQVDQRALLALLGAVILYFLVTFGLYALADLTAWRIDWHEARVSLEAAKVSDDDRRGTWVHPQLDNAVDAYWTVTGRSKWVARTRAAVDFGVPPLIGLYALYLIGARIF